MALDNDMMILLVEDASTMRKMELKILKQLGFTQIVEAVDGRAAMEKLETHDGIRLIITDWAMPEMDGYELLKWVRSRERFKDLPLIMATGQGDKAYVAKAMEAGATGVVAKPFTPDELKAKIDAAFGLERKPRATGDKRPRIDQKGKVRLKIAHIQITDHLTLGVIKPLIESGARSTEHVEVESHCMPGWNPVQDALEKGEVDAAFMLAPMAMDLFAYGVPLKLVMFSHRNGSIMVRNADGDYRKPFAQFFKHKSFFIPHKMSVHNMLAHMYFTQMGLKPGLAGHGAINVRFDVVPPIKMPDFLGDNPDSCGFMVAEPIGSRAIAAGVADRQLLSSELWENHPCCVAVFRDEFVQKYPEAVQDFCNLMAEAGHFIANQPNQSADLAVSFLDPGGKLGLTPEILKKVLTDPMGIKTDNLYPQMEDLDTIQRYMTDKMGIGRMIDLEAFVEPGFADVAYRDMEPPQRAKAADLGVFGTMATGEAREESAAAAGEDFTPSNAAKPLTHEGKYLTFGVSRQQYGISILDVREIIGMMPIRSVPRMPAHCKGVINLRDKVIPIIDLRLKFGMEPMDYTDRTCIIVVEVSSLSGSTLMGIVVDNVRDVSDIKGDEVQNAPEFGRSVNTHFILGMAKRKDGVTILLDIDQIVQTDELVRL